MTTTPSLEPGARKRYYLLHRWTGLLIAFVGTLVFFSGVIAVFHEELDGWANRGRQYAPVHRVADFSLDEAYTRAKAGVPAEYLNQVDIHQAHGGPLSFFFHKHVADGMNIEEVGTMVELDPANSHIVRSQTGPREVAMAPSTLGALAHFFIELHFYLLLPEKLGLVVTGAAGFGLLILIATGVLVHRPTVSKLLRPVRRRRGRILFGDLHKLIGSWTLPYTIVLAFTGVFFSFAGAVLIPVVAMVAFDGDQEALVRTIVGKVEVSESTATPSLDAVIRDARQRHPGMTFSRAGLDQWGEPEANATVTLVSDSPLGSDSVNLVYDGHNGAFLVQKPTFGTVPSLGDTLLTLFGDLHFGTLFGIITKVLWALFGLSTCALAATGLVIYALRLPAENAWFRWVRALSATLIGGLPLSTALTLLAWLGCVEATTRVSVIAMSLAFFVGLSGSLALGAMLSMQRSISFLCAASGASFVAVTVLAPAYLHASWSSVWADSSTRATLAVDVLFACTGICLLVVAGWLRTRNKSPSLLSPSEVAAE